MKTILTTALLIALTAAVHVQHVRAQDFDSYTIRYEHDSAARMTEFAVDTTASIMYAYDAGGSIISRTTAAPSGVDTDRDPSLPKRVALHAAYPNPFNPTTVIGFDLPTPQRVHLAVYDVLGRRVALLVDREEVAGRHEVRWNASNVGSGTYLVRMRAGSGKEFVRTVMLVR